MIYIILSVIGLLIIVALFTFFQKTKNEVREKEPVTPPVECCGAHAICEKGLKKITEKIDYFDDEELDRFRGVPSDTYKDEEIDLFREVLYTLRPEEINDWLISLEQREIALPEILRQEALEML